MKSLKILGILLLCALLLFAFAACTDSGDKDNNGKEQEKQDQQNGKDADKEQDASLDASPNEVMTAVGALGVLSETETFTDEDGGKELDEDSASFYFGTLQDDPDLSLFKEYALSSAVGYSADEVGIVVVENDKDIATVKEYFLTRIDNIKIKFRDYDTAEYEKASKAVVKSKGKVVYYIISSDNQAIEDTILSFIK